jgi:hypothetical protein
MPSIYSVVFERHPALFILLIAKCTDVGVPQLIDNLETKGYKALGVVYRLEWDIHDTGATLEKLRARAVNMIYRQSIGSLRIRNSDMYHQRK